MIKKTFYFFIFLFIGLILFFYNTAVTGFDLMPGNSGDAFLSNYILEHFWLWINQIPQHQSFWDMPFYYPQKNTLAYSDIMFGGALIYVPLRVIVKNPLSAFQIWVALICSANYTAFYFLLRRFKYSQFQSAVGAFVFAFGVMRYFKMNHPNYFIQYPIILSLLCISYVKQHKHLAVAGCLGCLSLQFWSVYTIGYMFCFVLLSGGFISLCFKTTRMHILSFIKEYYKEIILYGIVFIISLIPLAKHYLMLDMTRGWDEIFYHFVDFTIWFRNVSLLDNHVLKYLPVITEHEETCGGIGLITMFLAFCGLWKLKKYRKPIFLVILFIMLLCVKYGNNSPWFFVYKYLPGADGIRVVSRIYFILLIFYCLGVAEIFKSFHKKSLICLCLLLILTEQIPSSNHTYLWSKNEIIAFIKQSTLTLPKNCRVLYYYNPQNDGKLDVLVMWTASVNNMYSANGSSGVVRPKVWQDNLGYCALDIK